MEKAWENYGGPEGFARHPSIGFMPLSFWDSDPYTPTDSLRNLKNNFPA